MMEIRKPLRLTLLVLDEEEKLIREFFENHPDLKLGETCKKIILMEIRKANLNA